MSIEQPLNYAENNISQELKTRTEVIARIDEIKARMRDNDLERKTEEGESDRKEIIEEIRGHIENLADREENERIITSLNTLKERLETF